MKFFITIFLIVSSFFSLGQRNKNEKKYKEDLSKVHPKYVFDVDSLLKADTSLLNQAGLKTPFAENKRLHSVLDSIFKMNKDIKYIKGYTILVYSGNSQEEALEVRKAILQVFEDKESEFKNVPVEFKYHQPMFRIKVGEYTNRLEAVRMTEFLKAQEFDFGEESEIVVNPLVVPSNIEIKRK